MNQTTSTSAAGPRRPSRFRLLLAGSLVVTAAGLPLAQASSVTRANTPTNPAAAAPGLASAIAWSGVYRNDFKDLENVSAYQSSTATNSVLSPRDMANSRLQQPTLGGNVVVANDPQSSDGKALAVKTQQASYQTSTGTKYGWTNGHMMLTGQDQAPPVRIRARVKMTPSVKTKAAVMWSPRNGWPWDVHFAATFGGSSLTDYWGGRQHIGQRWHGDGVDADQRGSERLIHDDPVDAAQYHVYDLFVTPDRMWIEIDGVQTFQTTDPQFIPKSTGFFNVGKALTDIRAASDRTNDAVFLDWLEIYKPTSSPLDTSAPAAPTGVNAAGSTTGIRLAWTGNSESDVAGYNVYRAAAAAGPYVKANTALVAGTAYADTGAPTGATSYYQVTAVDTSGNESPRSAVASAAVADTTTPDAPTGLSAIGSANSIALAWTANTESDLAGYNVYRSAAATGPFTKLTGTPLRSANYVDTTVGGSTTAFYRVTAVDTSGHESAPSAIVRSTTVVSSQFSLRFQDDFTGSALNSGYWSVFHGAGNGTNGPKALVNSFVANGSMVLRAQPINGTWYGAGVCNCRVVQTYGKYEMRVRFDAGKGVKTAAMLWPAAGGWPPETDMYEISESDPYRTTNVLTNHWRDSAGVRHMEHGFIKGNYTQWHVVGVEWTPSALKFTLDGVVVKTMTANVPRVPMWFGMNVSLGPAGHGPDATTPSYVDANIDWIKIYKYNG